MSKTFLCRRCRDNMCQDCIDIADEFYELEQNRKNVLATLQHEVGMLKAENAKLKRRADMYEEVAKAGINDILKAWMDKEIQQLLKTTGV